MTFSIQNTYILTPRWRQLNCSDSTSSNQKLLKEETKTINDHKNTMLAVVFDVLLVII